VQQHVLLVVDVIVLVKILVPIQEQDIFLQKVQKKRKEGKNHRTTTPYIRSDVMSKDESNFRGTLCSHDSAMNSSMWNRMHTYAGEAKEAEETDDNSEISENQMQNTGSMASLLHPSTDQERIKVKKRYNTSRCGF